VILPTGRALWTGAVLSLVGVLGFWIAGAVDLLLAADAVLLLLIWLDATRAISPRAQALGVARDAPPAMSLGRAGAVTYRWSNESSGAARLRVREIRPDLLGGSQPPRLVAVAARGVARETLPLAPARRGRARPDATPAPEGEGGAFVIDSTGPWGLGMRRGWKPLPWEVVVYPASTSTRLRAALGEPRRRDPGLMSVRRLGEGRLFESLREWVPGDDVRHVDWKATARRRKVITRQFQAERREHVMLVLDTGRLLTAEIAGTARLEYAVQAALELAEAAIRQDDSVGVMSFADGVRHYVPPQRGRIGLRRVLDVLADVEPRLVEPDYPGAFRYLAVRNRKRALTVLFTDVIDRFASDALVANVASLRPRHLPVVVTLRDPELDRMAHARPRDTRAAYRKAAAEELLRAREEALAQMRRSGVIVLDVPPQRAARAVVNQYLELKRRGRL
jgi:uncharacterized protein (DUF58 family)